MGKDVGRKDKKRKSCKNKNCVTEEQKTGIRRIPVIGESTKSVGIK